MFLIKCMFIDNCQRSQYQIISYIQIGVVQIEIMAVSIQLKLMQSEKKSEEQVERVGSFKSLAYNSELNSSKNEQEEKNMMEVDPFYQIDIKPQSSLINRDQILKIFKQLQGEERNSRAPIKKPNSALTKRKSQSQQVPSKKIQFGHLDIKVRQKIDKMTKTYRTMFKPSLSDVEIRRVGYQNKEKLFLYLLYGVQQLRILDKHQINQLQNIVKMGEKQQFEVIKRIVAQVDRAMIQNLNKGARGGIATREYRLQWGNLTSNVRDEKNQELRRKILNKTLTPQKIAQAKEFQFYTTAKRQEIFRKQKQYLAQFQAEEKQVVANQENQPIQAPLISSYSQVQKNQQSQKSSSKYINESTIPLLRSLVGMDQIHKMKKRLEDDLFDENVKNRLLTSLNKTFKVTQ